MLRLAVYKGIWSAHTGHLSACTCCDLQYFQTMSVAVHIQYAHHNSQYTVVTIGTADHQVFQVPSTQMMAWQNRAGRVLH